MRLRRLLEASTNRCRGARGRGIGGGRRWLCLDHEQHERGAEPGANLHGQRALWLVGDGGSAVGVRDGTPPEEGGGQSGGYGSSTSYPGARQCCEFVELSTTGAPDNRVKGYTQAFATARRLRQRN
jgi:hypothetical protein